MNRVATPSTSSEPGVSRSTPRTACTRSGSDGAHGKAALRSLSSLAEPVREHTVEAIRYFGDLDAAGLEIAYGVTQHAKELELPPVKPAPDLYERLLVRGAEVAAFAGDGRMPAAEVRAWLPAASRTGARELFERGERLPQELVGWEQLSEGGAGSG